MFYLLIGFIFFLIQLLLTATTKINLFPETFFLPWLINRGLLPYRDFFNHHGFLFYYLLAPFSRDKSLLVIKIFFFLIINLNLTLFLLILRKITNKIGYVLGGLLYTLLVFFIVENNLWDEVIIATFYLLIYLVVISRYKNKALVIGFLIALASFIKPTSIIIIVPIFFINKNYLTLISFFISWLLVLSGFFLNHSLKHLVDNLFVFNSYFPGYILKEPYNFFGDKKFISITLFLLLFSLYLIVKSKKVTKNLLTISFALCSLVFLYPKYDRSHLIVTITFIVILTAATVRLTRIKLKKIYLILVISYLAFVGFLVKDHYFYLRRNRRPYFENRKTKSIVAYIKNNHLDKKPLYIFGNQVEIYYLLDRLPPVYFPLILPGFTDHYKNIQLQIIDSLAKNRIKMIIVPKPLERYYINFSQLGDFIKENYQLKVAEKDFNIYLIN